MKLSERPSTVIEKFLKSVTEGVAAKLTSLITAKLVFVEVGIPIDAAALLSDTALITRVPVAELIVSWLLPSTATERSSEPSLPRN